MVSSNKVITFALANLKRRDGGIRRSEKREIIEIQDTTKKSKEKLKRKITLSGFRTNNITMESLILAQDER